MKRYLLAIKIAVVFLVVMGLSVVLTVHFFADIVLWGGRPFPEAHSQFVNRVLQIWFVAMVVLSAFAVFVTAPLRRMSRSMDRIAAGDLGHRVRVRGRDEGAAMGRSFNEMADRVRGMIVGQKELMAGVSHELRSPLARMKVAIALLREGKGGAEHVDALDADVDALDALVRELLLASRLDLGAAPLERTSLDLESLCRVAWARVAGEAAERGMVWELRCAPGAAEVAADEALAVRVLGNLFENAVRHAGTGTVAVSATRDGDRVRIEVRDRGPGVPDADLERLFEPFFRADRSRSRRTGGEGLGLMIVRRAVATHGGDVRAENAEGGGLVVAFDLPAA
jgi:signal transduction histidine kinase